MACFQHGFRAHRSTMSALSEVQQKWATNTEAKEIAGNNDLYSIDE